MTNQLEKQLEAENYRINRMSLSEWIKIIPEAEPYLKARLQELELEKQDLEKSMEKQISKINDTIKFWKEIQKYAKTDAATKTIQDYEDFWMEVVKNLTGERFNSTCKAIRAIRWAIYPSKKNGSGITPEMIEQAKNFPFEELIKIERGNFAICPFHNDTHPSLYCKNNFYYCFSCGANGDVIDFIMKTEDLTFPEAVRKLI